MSDAADTAETPAGVDPASGEGAAVVIGQDVPEIPPGTVLRLAKGEWSTGNRNLAPAETHVVVRVDKVHTDRVPDVDTDRVDEGTPGVWVSGHMLECEWPSVERHPPCAHLFAFFGPLRSAAKTAREAGTE